MAIVKRYSAVFLNHLVPARVLSIAHRVHMFLSLLERLKLDCVGSSANCAQIPGHGRFSSEAPYLTMLLPPGRTGGIAYRGRGVAPPRRRPIESVGAVVLG